MKRSIVASPFSSSSSSSLSLLCLFPHLVSCRPSKSLVSCVWPSVSPADVVSRIINKMRRQKLLLCFFLVLCNMTTGALGVRVYDVRVPHPAIVGQPAQLECLWESGDKDFYSVRWYMNNEQFYSYILGNLPEKVNHRLQGINVDLTSSNQNVVTLSEVTQACEGMYRCELMSEGPVFQTSFASENLTVVNLPNEPEVNGFQLHYRVGDTLNVTCIARHANPAARISFHVNKKKIHRDSSRVRDLGVVESGLPGTYTSSSRLVLPLSYRHAPTLTLTCRAHIYDLTEETSVTAQVDPARTPILSFFNGGVACGVPACHHGFLVGLLALMLHLEIPCWCILNSSRQ